VFILTSKKVFLTPQVGQHGGPFLKTLGQASIQNKEGKAI
jgi:hypothetical protein